MKPLRAYDAAAVAGDKEAMDAALVDLKADYPYFGYGYLDSPEEAVPPVAMTFYSFHIMVIAGGYLLLFFAFRVCRQLLAPAVAYPQVGMHRRHAVDSDCMDLFAGRMDYRRSGPPAVGHPGHPAYTCGNKRHRGIIGDNHILHVCSGVYRASRGGNEHNGHPNQQILEENINEIAKS